MRTAIFHPSTRNGIITQFASDHLSGVSTLAVKNSNGFIANKPIILGLPGFQQSEIVKVSSVTAPSTIGLSANTVFAHTTDQRITYIDYDQIKVYRSTTGITGVYSLLGSPFNITIEQDMTIYEDATSQPTYYYKYSYFNSIDSLESDLSDPIAATGFNFYSLKTLIDRVLSLFGDADGDYVSRPEVRDYINEKYEYAQKELAIATKRMNIKNNSFTVAMQVQEYSNALASDFLMEKAIRVSRDGGITFPYFAVSGSVDSLGSVYQTNVLYKYYIYGSTIGLDPLPQNSTDIVKIYYVPVPSLLTYQTDVLGTPFQNSSAMFVKGALSMCYLKDKKTTEYQLLDAHFEAQLKIFISYIKKMQSLHPQFTEIMDPSVL